MSIDDYIEENSGWDSDGSQSNKKIPRVMFTAMKRVDDLGRQLQKDEDLLRKIFDDYRNRMTYAEIASKHKIKEKYGPLTDGIAMQGVGKAIRSGMPPEELAEIRRERGGGKWSEEEREDALKLKQSGMKHRDTADTLNEKYHSGEQIRTEASVKHCISHHRKNRKEAGEPVSYKRTLWSEEEKEDALGMRQSGMKHRDTADTLNEKYHSGEQIRTEDGVRGYLMRKRREEGQTTAPHTPMV